MEGFRDSCVIIAMIGGGHEATGPSARALTPPRVTLNQIFAVIGIFCFRFPLFGPASYVVVEHLLSLAMLYRWSPPKGKPNDKVNSAPERRNLAERFENLLRIIGHAAPAPPSEQPAQLFPGCSQTVNFLRNVGDNETKRCVQRDTVPRPARSKPRLNVLMRDVSAHYPNKRSWCCVGD